VGASQGVQLRSRRGRNAHKGSSNLQKNRLLYSTVRCASLPLRFAVTTMTPDVEPRSDLLRIGL
jgi:hypothetical protein